MRPIALVIGAILLASFAWGQTPALAWFTAMTPEKQKAQCADIEQRDTERMQQGLHAVHPFEEFCYPAKSFEFTNKPTAKGLQEIVSTLRTIVQMTDAQMSVDPDAATITVRVAPGKQEMVAWLIRQLDQPPYVQGQRATGDAVHEMLVPLTEQDQPTKNDDAMRVFFLARTGTQRGFQEINSILRLLGDFPKVNGESEQFVLVVRAPAAQLDLAAYLIQALDVVPGSTKSSAEFKYAPPDTPLLRLRAGNALPPNEVVRVFYPVHGTTLKSMQQIVNSSSALLGTSKMFWDTEVTAIPVRGTAADIATAQWLIEALDVPSGPNTAVPADREFDVPASSTDDGLIRVFYVGKNTTPDGLRGVLTRLQADAGVKLASIASPPALIVRGSPAKIEQVGPMIVSGLQTAP